MYIFRSTKVCFDNCRQKMVENIQTYLPNGLSEKAQVNPIILTQLLLNKMSFQKYASRYNRCE